ncbi:aminomethyl-transferring glycine dehydrogenase [candidate division GN15 bacterium]|uniref:Probable glycine dehydrogenase (decarboxylating) subunit 1 n=1 Tax=candidate division GN15 bacterium TaxID=2072418 RepID=A0A855WWX9_9BACT|nr:MAG: aminomethyl-transferring glycine dehydrogenase [candidate division GN15 bacterium]
MQNPYIPNTDDDRRRMLERIGVGSFEDLLVNIPQQLRLKRSLRIPQLSEMELLKEMAEMSMRNREGTVCFAGGGVYDHFIPAAVGAITSRPEFVTAYTPYQPEVSQGTLQVIYEFQTHMCRLTGLDVANASMYDGASAAAEAAVIAMAVTKRHKVVVSEAVSPLFREVIATYTSGRDIELVTVPMKDGVTDLNRLEDAVDEKTACVLVAQPNFFGMLEEIAAIEKITHQVNAKLIMAVDLIAQALLKTPGESGADIAIAEGQPLGLPVSFGGPLLGVFAVKKDLVRFMPGRLVARTKDVDGKTGFVLTLQTREQHIRREKATSNICTNQALCATTAAVYLSLLGKQGLKQVALLSMERAHAAAERIFSVEGYSPCFTGPFVREFAVKTPHPATEVVLRMTEKGIVPGVDAGRWYKGMENCLIVAATEKRTEAEIDRLVAGLKEMRGSGVLSRM